MTPVSGGRFQWRHALAASAVAWILAFSPGTAASPESRALVRQGAAELANRKFEEALRKFEVAVRADPADAQAVFFRGAALNRLGRHAEALPRLQEAAGRSTTTSRSSSAGPCSASGSGMRPFPIWSATSSRVRGAGKPASFWDALFSRSANSTVPKRS